jgi:hypothetical protein
MAGIWHRIDIPTLNSDFKPRDASPRRHSSPLTAELEIRKQMASAISSARIKRLSCV